MELVSTKILVLTLLGAVRLLFGLVPLKITKKLKLWGDGGVYRRAQVVVAISLCLSFGGGVLLATCFIHMIPEVRESLEAVKRRGSSVISHNSSFPFAELLICCGFFLVYAIEEVAHRLFTHSGNTQTRPAQCCSTVEAELRKAEDSGDTDVRVSAGSRPRTDGKTVPLSSQVHLVSSSLSLDQTVSRQDSLRNFLVVVALSFHSAFEGLAIGLQQTQRDVWYLFTAVSVHACVILFCVGLELATSSVRLLNLVLYIVILSLVSPLGVVVGILMTVPCFNDGAVQDLIVAVLQGIAGGTILYVTFFEVLYREKRKEIGGGIVRIVFTFLGFILMVALQALGE
jgi:zinc transporter 1/2/3